MAYKALYRTYRPQKFSEVVGQEHIVKTLQNAIVNQKISHAYLFSGPRGTGKTSVARIFAKALNCTSLVDNEPCGQCTSCREIASGISPDVVEIDAASNNSVDEIREIRDKVKFLPSGSKYKIYIIDEVHMLSQGAFNALLKTLEEPPKHVIFILATTEPHKVIPTILSRCQRFDFKTLNIYEISRLLKNVSKTEGIKISDEAINAIAESAEGGMRDALSILDQAASFADDIITVDDVYSVTGNLSFEKIIELARYFEEKNINQALKTINDLIIMGKEVSKITSSLLQFYRDCLLYKNIDTSMFTKFIFNKDEFKELANTINTEKIFYYIDCLSEVQSKIKVTSTPGIYLEVAVIKMINSNGEEINYQKKIFELEEKINSLNLNPSISTNDTDNEKFNTLELRLNKVINELNRLDLPKLNEKILNLQDVQIDSNFEKKINELIAKVYSLENKLNDKTENNQINYQDEIEKIKTIIIGIQSDIYELKTLKNSNKDSLLVNELVERIKNLESDVKVLKEGISKDLSEDVKYDFEIMKDKINNLESKVYKLMSGELEKIEAKKFKINLKGKQIGLFGDEIVNLNELKKSKTSSLDNEEIRNNNNTEKKETIENKEVETKDAQEENAKVIIKTKDEEIIESKHSQLVRKINQNEGNAIVKEEEIVDNIVNKEKELENEEIKTTTRNYVVPMEMAEDEFSRYEVSVLERILHDSRTEFARADRTRILNLWKSLDRSVPKSQLHIANLLQNGKVVATGIKEFVLVYPNSALCNQVMKLSFKKESLKLLYDFLGDTYNYFAIPEQVWQEKRTEYINQYNIGIRYPKLTPINDPSLNVIEENKEYLKNLENSKSKAIAFFGEDLVKIE